MYALRYDISGTVGETFQPVYNVAHAETEWFYSEEGIALCGWEVLLEHCFLRHLWTRNEPIIIEKSQDGDHDVIRREREEGGFMGGPAYGTQEINTLVNLIERSGTVHIYRAHLLSHPSDANNLFVFSQRAPDQSLYTAPVSIPIRFQEHEQGGELLEKLLRRSVSLFPKREARRSLVSNWS